MLDQLEERLGRPVVSSNAATYWYALRMMGTLEKGDQFWAILRDPDSIIHRVQTGNYIGQNHGNIIEVTETNIKLLEIIPDGRGGWEERKAELALAE